MAVVVPILDGKNVTRDFGIQGMQSAILSDGVWRGHRNECLVTAGQVETGVCFVKVTRDNITPSEEFTVPVSITSQTAVDTSTDGYIIIKLDDSKVNLGLTNSPNGDNIATIENVSVLPSKNYFVLAEISGATIHNPNDRFAKINLGMVQATEYYGMDISYTSDIIEADIFGIDKLEDGAAYKIKVANDNTGACTVNINGFGAKDLKKMFDKDVLIGDIKAGQIVKFVYDADNDYFQMTSHRAQKDSIILEPRLFDYGNGEDGDVTISSNTTLSRDMYYNNLTVDNGITLHSNGYRIFVRDTCTINGTVENSGGNGGNGGNGGVGSASGGAGGTGGTGGSGGAGGSAGTLPVTSSGMRGSDGAAGGHGVGQNSNGQDGLPGVTGADSNGMTTLIHTNVTAGIGGNSGGKGGDTAYNGGNGGGGSAGGSAIASSLIHTRISTYENAVNLAEFHNGAYTQYIVTNDTAGAGTGGGGGSGATGNGGNSGGGGGSAGSGGGGGAGGVVFIAAQTLVISNTASVESVGGNGGNGGIGGDAGASGGSASGAAAGSGGGAGGTGGNGGNGGCIVMVYNSGIINGTVSAAAGAGGTGGTGGSGGVKYNTGGDGEDGSAGNDGVDGFDGLVVILENPYS